jgi:hypothetical protein
VIGCLLLGIGTIPLGLIASFTHRLRAMFFADLAVIAIPLVCYLVGVPLTEYYSREVMPSSAVPGLAK